jgi:predicted amidophosphoribosyltransferase
MSSFHLQEIDELLRREHCYLESEDNCYFFGEYTPLRELADKAEYYNTGFNQLISNLKKPPSKKSNVYEWRHKLIAIAKAASMFRSSLGDKYLMSGTIVPIPPSKIPSDPEYDDRMIQMVSKMVEGLNADVRELITLDHSMTPTHASDRRLKPEELEPHYSVNEACANPAPTSVFLFDDVITNGSHYKAIQSVLKKRFPGVSVIGFFIARTIHPVPDAAAIFPEITAEELEELFERWGKRDSSQ